MDTTQRQPRSPFSDEEIRQASPERRAWLFRVLALAHQTGAPVALAQRAVEEADKQTVEEAL